MRRFLALICVLACLPAAALDRLPTGARLDPAAATTPVGNFPLALAVAPGGDRIALLLCGWREQGVQIIDLTTGAVSQTIAQPAAFVGLAFSPDGRWLAASGGNDDSIYLYAWSEGRAALAARIALVPGAPKGAQYPAGLAFSRSGKRLYVAENLGDSVAVIDVDARAVIQRLQTDRYPYGVAVAKSGDVYVSSWGDDTVVRFRPRAEHLVRDSRIVVGRHPSALLIDEGRGRLYAASGSTDTISVVALRSGRVTATLSDHPPGVSEGSTPNALALASDGRLFVAEADANAVAVFREGKLTGRIPTEWYPSAVAISRGELLVASAKGRGTAPNPAGPQPGKKYPKNEFTLGQLDGSLMRVPLTIPPDRLRAYSRRVSEANGWNVRRSAIGPQLKHVIYVIKENRTYDQVFGDLPGADGDPSLVFFGRDVMPNHRALAERFGIFDRFFVNAEVSADGHNWSTAAYATDYLQKTVPSEYSSRGRDYDYEGANRGRIVDEDDDVAAPAAGYLWTLALRKKISLRDFGEFVAGGHDVGAPDAPGMSPTRRELIGYSSPTFPGFDLSITDQKRADIWLEEFRGFVERGSMPQLQIVRLPNDHTAGGKAGMPTPRAFAADNDLALGRIVDALTHSPFWRDTVMFVLEDDAQNGADHVDSHRSILLVISPYNHPGVVHRFANTTDVLATIEEILGLGSLSQFDHYGRPLREAFAKDPDLRPFDAIRPAVDLDEKNPPETPAAKKSASFDFSRPDAIDDAAFNRVLWEVVKGTQPPAVTRHPRGALAP